EAARQLPRKEREESAVELDDGAVLVDHEVAVDDDVGQLLELRKEALERCHGRTLRVRRDRATWYIAIAARLLTPATLPDIDAIFQSDYTPLRSFVPDIAKEDPEVAYVFVADKDGMVLAHSDKAQQGKPLADAAAKDLLAAKDFVAKNVTTAAGQLYVFARPVV